VAICSLALGKRKQIQRCMVSRPPESKLLGTGTREDLTGRPCGSANGEKGARSIWEEGRRIIIVEAA